MFTPGRNGVTSVPVRLPLESSIDPVNGISTQDYVGLTVLAPNGVKVLFGLAGELLNAQGAELRSTETSSVPQPGCSEGFLPVRERLLAHNPPAADRE